MHAHIHAHLHTCMPRVMLETSVLGGLVEQPWTEGDGTLPPPVPPALLGWELGGCKEGGGGGLGVAPWQLWQWQRGRGGCREGVQLRQRLSHQ